MHLGLSGEVRLVTVTGGMPTVLTLRQIGGIEIAR